MSLMYALRHRRPCNQMHSDTHLPGMDKKILPAIAGISAAIAITTTLDATGYTVFSALPLFPLTALFWYLQKFSRAEIGLAWGPPYAYGLALAYPAIVLSLIGLIAFLAGAVDTSQADWNKTFLNMALMSSTGVILVTITEEGFFRGWLWASLKRAGKSDLYVLVWTSLAFTAWHISAISLDTGFDVPANEIPIYLVNATFLGLVWGLLRQVSGSVVVPAVCHSVWNGIDYPLYGFGEKVGALGIEETHIYGPEVGIIVVAINAVVVGALFYKLSWNRK
jgi:membrane protease YdiL (CAAX protease family)